jgi:hypothetical protein
MTEGCGAERSDYDGRKWPAVLATGQLGDLSMHNNIAVREKNILNITRCSRKSVTRLSNSCSAKAASKPAFSKRCLNDAC